MFLKQEKDEKDDFERKKTSILKEKYFKKIQYVKKILWKIYKFLMENAKILNYIFAYSFVSEYSKHFFFVLP